MILKDCLAIYPLTRHLNKIFGVDYFSCIISHYVTEYQVQDYDFSIFEQRQRIRINGQTQREMLYVDHFYIYEVSLLNNVLHGREVRRERNAQGQIYKTSERTYKNNKIYNVSIHRHMNYNNRFIIEITDHNDEFFDWRCSMKKTGGVRVISFRTKN